MPKIKIRKPINEQSFLDTIRKKIGATQTQSDVKPGDPSAPVSLDLDPQSFKKFYTELQKIQDAMKSMNEISKDLVDLSKKNKALEPLAKQTVDKTTDILKNIKELVEPIVKSMQAQK